VDAKRVPHGALEIVEALGSACTNVPNRHLTVADALAALKSGAIAPIDARGLRRALPGVLAAIDDAE
jgi:hypothetical protein